MKYFVIAILCLSAVSSQYHGSTGLASGGYGGHQTSIRGISGGHHRSGSSLSSQSYSVVGDGHISAGPDNSGSHGHSGHRMSRSVSVLPIVGHSGVGHMSGGYTQGGHYGGHRYARSVIAIAPMARHGSHSGLALTVGHYGSVAGHGHRMVRSPVGYSRGSYRCYSNAGLQRSSMVGRWGDE